MRVKAIWPVDTGRKEPHAAGAEFDVSPELASELKAAGAVEIVERKRGGEPKNPAGTQLESPPPPDPGAPGAPGGSGAGETDAGADQTGDQGGQGSNPGSQA
ncbi:hypothetical protein ACKI2N_001965 [Cupriavidus sp. 30B13]|uniref:hypothetical protein n=1 Tax=Cupriavidus sp. 30B13 TaxID=3384241 RepID=UPI003B8EC1D3